MPRWRSRWRFRFGNLAEVRYFLKQLDYLSNQHSTNTSNLSPLTFHLSHWHEAKQRTLEKYATSKCLDVMRHFFADFEATHKAFYRSDLQEFVFESNIEDFIAADGNSVFVSTIHKAKDVSSNRLSDVAGA
jgi:hypothetical protein